MNRTIKEIPSELKSLQDQFTEWRKHRSHKTQAIPKSLLLNADRLVNKYGTSLVLTTLGVNYTQLKRARTTDRVSGRNKKQGMPSPFVEVLTTGGIAPYSIEITRPNGMRLVLTGAERGVVEAAISGFIRDGLCCS